MRGYEVETCKGTPLASVLHGETKVTKGTRKPSCCTANARQKLDRPSCAFLFLPVAPNVPPQHPISKPWTHPCITAFGGRQGYHLHVLSVAAPSSSLFNTVTTPRSDRSTLPVNRELFLVTALPCFEKRGNAGTEVTCMGSRHDSPFGRLCKIPPFLCTYYFDYGT